MVGLQPHVQTLSLGEREGGRRKEFNLHLAFAYVILPGFIFRGKDEYLNPSLRLGQDFLTQLSFMNFNTILKYGTQMYFFPD